MSGRERLEWGPVEVTADDVALFARGIDFAGTRPHPLFVATVLIPGSAKILVSSELDTQLQRIVHAGLALTFYREVEVGGQLSCQAWLEALDEKQSGRLIAIGVEIRDGDEVICDGVTSYFERGPRRGNKSAPPEPMTGGRQVEIATRPDQSIRYAEGSGDRFPIHTDDDFARAVGLPGKIMHGMCTLALSVNGALDDVYALRSLTCRFATILLPGDTIAVHVVDEPHGCRFESRRGDGKAVILEGHLT